jgi:GntR family transcriptional regulator
VRKALSLLVQEKILYNIQGSGTFVSEENFNQTLLKFYSFTEEMKKRGKTPTSKILSFQKLETDEVLKKKMKNTNKYVYELIRLRLADEEIVMYEVTYLNYELIKDLTLEKLNKKPLYEILRKDYKINFDRATEKFKAIIPTEKIMEKLELSNLKACMQLERKTYSENKVLEYTKSFARGDKLTFEIELK